MRYKEQGAIFITDSILGVLLLVSLFAAVSIGAPAFFDLGRSDRALSDTAALGGMISQYELEVGSYPATLKDLTQKNGQYGPWLKEIPKDPWTSKGDYIYTSNSTGYLIYSVGKDKVASSNIDTGIAGDDIGFVGR